MPAQRIAILDASPDVAEGLGLLFRAHGHIVFIVPAMDHVAASLVALNVDTILVGGMIESTHCDDVAAELRVAGFAGRLVCLEETDCETRPRASRSFNDYWQRPLLSSRILTFAAAA